MDTVPNRVHVVWLGDGPIPYPDHIPRMRSILRGWDVMVWTKENRPDDPTLDTLIKGGDLELASQYYRILLLELHAGFYVSYNVRLDKHLRPLQVFATEAGGLVFAAHDCTYSGNDYLGIDVLMAERVQKTYKNSFNLRKHFWARRFRKYCIDSMSAGGRCGSELLTKYFNDQSAATDSMGRDRHGRGMVRQTTAQRLWGVQIMSDLYFCGVGPQSHGEILPNLGY